MIVDIEAGDPELVALVERALAGEEIVLARTGIPMARLVPCSPREGRRKPGAWRGMIRISEDFDELPDEVAAAFRGDRP